MKPSVFVLVFVLIPFGVFACAKSPVSEVDRQRYVEAVALQNAGRLGDALPIYSELVRGAESASIRAKAELEASKIEVAIEDRDRSLNHLDALASQVDVQSLAFIEGEIDRVVARYAETPFANEIQTKGNEARGETRRRHESAREVQRTAVRELIARGRFDAAVELIRRIETERPSKDRNDLVGLLVEVHETSDSVADARTRQFDAAHATDPVAAVRALKNDLAAFRGTRAYARLLAVYEQHSAELPAEPAEKPASDDPKAAHGNG